MAGCRTCSRYRQNRRSPARARATHQLLASKRAHARRKLFDHAQLKSPLAIDAVNRIDALFAVETEINGTSIECRQRVRNEHSRPPMTELETWLRSQRKKLSAKSRSLSTSTTNEIPGRSYISPVNAWSGGIYYTVDVTQATCECRIRYRIGAHTRTAHRTARSRTKAET